MRLPLQLTQRLRPFLRRDLRARLTSAVVAVSVLFGLTWLGVSALGRIDSSEAHQLRVDLGLEAPFAVCGDVDQPSCSYDDRAQAKVDREFAHAQMMRRAVLSELVERVDLAQDRLEEATALVEAAKSSKSTGVLQGDTVALKVALLQSVVDLRPAQVASVEIRRARILWPLQVMEECQTTDFDETGWLGCTTASDKWRQGGAAPDMRTALRKQLELERVTLAELSDNLQRLLARDVPKNEQREQEAAKRVSRSELTASVLPEGGDAESFSEGLELAAWLAVRPPASALQGWDLFDAEQGADLMSSSVHHAAAASGLRTVDDTLATAAVVHADELRELVFQPGHESWHGAWTDPYATGRITKATERYRSPLSGSQQWQIIGTVLFLLSGIMLVVVGPVVTATTTAREREAGTLPVLRMTGMSAGDLALAMTVGPNVFALIAGAGLLTFALPMLLLTVGPGALVMPVGALLTLAAATHLTAIGLGDALGQRVNAMVVGGLLALGLLGPGLVGATMVVGDMAATGFLLGPLPLTIASGLGLSGMPFAADAATGGSSDLGPTIAGYALVIQALFGLMCLMSWRRRVEQPWAPLFRPFEGALLALASVGCSALAVLDLSERVHVQTYDDVNLITFVAVGFLVPVLGWLLVTSLVRPARASSVASVSEARRGFLRFQLFVMLTAGALAIAYQLVLERTGLASEQSEVMWATLAHGLMIGQTIVATLLWTSRRRHGRHRSLMMGASVVILQLIAAGAIYGMEVNHVAVTRAAANPFLLGMGASPYLTAFLVLLWAAGLGLILAAVLRERDRSGSDDADSNVVEDDEQGRRWLH
ncbi:MAG: hypothetical protein ACRBN8_00175 [Nannocystales bacterium]